MRREPQILQKKVPGPLPSRPLPRKQSVLDGHGGFSSVLPRLQHMFEPEPSEYTVYRERRREAIKDAFLHGWQGYKTYALGHDELKPLTNKTHDPFGGWGATMIDSLSTLLVMGLDNEVSELVPLIRKIDFMVDEDLNVFESVIRYLGGLLSAYDLTERKTPMYLNQAEKLAQVLLPAFDTLSGLPTHLWNPVRNMSIHEETLIAEAGTVQLEFMMLSKFTGKDIYIQKAQAVTDLLDTMGYEHGMYIQGLYPTRIDTEKGRFRDETTTFGAMGDSAFEYFLKQYLLTDGKKPQYGKMYLKSIRSMKQYMLRQIPGYDMLFLPPFDTEKEQADDSMDHLTCFVPGMLAMGSKTFNEPEDMEIAKRLLETCVFMYRTTKTGLSAESWFIDKHEKYNPLTFNQSKEILNHARDWWYEEKTEEKREKRAEQKQKEYDIEYQLPKARARPETLYFGDERYLLRPETLESLFILYRMTGEQRYQEYGWEIFRAIERWCKTESAFAAIEDVDREKKEGNQIDSMESFLFAETFKYLYLLFSPPDMLSLDKFVLNTEAHPFIRRHWNWDGI
ncbi:glycoside hydrolase [Sporodiniella umbellata]|nr:glycoside hydrolase [Sporodiniella umbellata]